MAKRFVGAGVKAGRRQNPANQVVSMSPRKQTKRPVHRNGNIPPQLRSAK